MHSAIYSGWLEHRRMAPRRHAFRYRLFMVYLDLSELDRVFAGRWLWSTRRPALARFDRRDHFGDPAVPLDRAVRDLVAERIGRRPCGPVRLLAHLRYFGYVFNPVSFYYCFDAADRHVEAIVAEVSNTPWGERHCYVLDGAATGEGRWLNRRCEKAMHVSPFNPMALDYHWSFRVPDRTLAVRMALTPRDTAPAPDVLPILDATLALQRAPMTARTLASALLRYPMMTLRVIAGIHWQALRLWIKRVPIHDHPTTRRASPRHDAFSENPP